MSRRELQIAAILEKTQPEEDAAKTGSHNRSDGKDDWKYSEFGEKPLSEWWINAHFYTGEANAEQLTFSPKDEAKESALDRADKQWRQRLDTNRAEVLLSVRDTMIGMARLLRHHRSLVWNADDGLLLWEIARKTPEGMTCGVCRTQQGREILEQYARTLTDLDRPLLEFRPESADSFLGAEAFREILYNFQYNGALFDRIFFRDPFTSKDSIDALATAFANAARPKKQQGTAFTDSLDAEAAVEDSVDSTDGTERTSEESPFAEGWAAIIAQKIPSGGQHISQLIKEQILTPATVEPYRAALEKMEKAEKDFFSDNTNTLFNWDGGTIAESFRNAGFKAECASQIVTEKRRISGAEIRKWFDGAHSVYGAQMETSLPHEELQKLVRLLEIAAEKQIFNWRTQTAFFTVSAAGNER